MRIWMKWMLFSAAIAALAVLPAAVWAQNAKGKGKGKGVPAGPAPTEPSPNVPRAADGHPDLTGVWQAGSTRIGTWEEANADGSFGGGVGRVTPYAIRQPNERPPYQEWAAKKVIESFNRRGIDDPMARCLPPGVPRTTTMGLFPMQIVQTPDTVVMLFEVFHVFRVIPIGAPHLDDIVPSMMGTSVGRWEGDTLVVDAIGFNDLTWLAGTGTIHTDQLRVVEKFRRMDENTIVYEATMTDPGVFTKPWTIRSTFMLRPGTRLQEYECAENNIDIQRYEKLLEDESVFRRQ
jgi:hypothetical protein